MSIKKPIIISPCYFPTTVLLIDDDPIYSDILGAKLLNRFIIKVENDARKALEFLNNLYSKNDFWSRCFNKFSRTLTEFEKISLNISNLKQLLYSSDRFKQVTMIVADFAMPTLNGIELLRDIDEIDKTIRIPPKRILLTGVLNSPVSIQNDIDAFYKKADSLTKLEQQIDRDQKSLFADIFLGTAMSLAQDEQNKTICFTDEKFIKLLKTYMQQFDIVEYYLLDQQGSLILLDRKSNLFWLLIRNANGIKSSIELAKKFSAPAQVIEDLTLGKKILYIPDEDQITNIISWEDYLHPAKILEGQENYYYAFVDHLKYHCIEKNKIVSLDMYLKTIAA